MSTGEIIWVVIGGAGQLCFGGRMLLQWWASERLGRSVVPAAFWHLSLVGGVMMLAYACWRLDPVFMGGQVLSLGIYVRNLVLLRKEKIAAVPVTIPSPDIGRPVARSQISAGSPVSMRRRTVRPHRHYVLRKKPGPDATSGTDRRSIRDS